MNLPLNIDLQQILLHLFNFVLLFAILYYFLYDPVKKFMDKRTEHYRQLEEEAKLNLEHAERTKEEYLKKLASAEEEISAKKEEARRELEEAKALRVQQAEKEAAKILADAQQSLEKERTKMLREVQGEISDLVACAAEKLVLESSTSETYDLFLNAAKRSETDEGN